MHVGGRVLAPRAGELGKLSLLLGRECEEDAHSLTPDRSTDSDSLSYVTRTWESLATSLFRQYMTGAKNPELVSPDGAVHDQFLLDRKGNDEILVDLFLSYGSNPPLYPSWQAYFREHQPPTTC